MHSFGDIDIPLTVTFKVYPDLWRSNLLVPVHKKGDVSDPVNYRGIALSNCLSKIFCSLIGKRLENFVTQHSLIPCCQIGFTARRRTTDHILVLKTLVDKYLNKNKKPLFSCFVDFKCAFDSVWRNGLIFKMMKCNISSKFINLIENMYKVVNYQVKFENGISPPIPSETGVKQGCVMSPLLFKIFLRDLPDIFSSDCDPVELYDSKVSCLLYADDLILLSETSAGLQLCLHKLLYFCNKWDLCVNIAKTKVIIFNKSGRLLKKFIFKFGNVNIETVKSYVYLGIPFVINGSFMPALKQLKDKAIKANYGLFNMIFKYNINITTACKLFDTLVLPILSYGSEVWLPYLFDKFDITSLLKLCDDKISVVESVNIKFCKLLLGVNKKAVNHAVRGELGKFPIAIGLIEHALKFWFRTVNLDNQALVWKAYAENYNLNKSGINTWITFFQKVTYGLKFENLWVNQGSSNIKSSCKNVLNAIKTEYEKQWLASLDKNQKGVAGEGKLRTYCKFKFSFSCENYLKCISDKDVRKTFTKLRISSHSLNIETGRHTRPKKTPVENRLCHYCTNNSIETEFHFICNCDLYDTLRSSMYAAIADITPDFTSLDSEHQFIRLLSYFNGDYEYCQIVCKYVYDCFRLRSLQNN